MTNPLDRLAPREREVLKVLLTEGELAASEIERSLPDPASNSAVRTMLTRLEVKGLVTHRQAGAKYLYRAVIPRGRARKRAVKDIVSVFFEGSPGRAAIAILGSANFEVSDEELERLEALIRKAKAVRK